jgi:hypothetical protein
MSQNLNLKFNLTFTQNNQEHNISVNNLFDRLVSEYKIPFSDILAILICLENTSKKFIKRR